MLERDKVFSRRHSEVCTQFMQRARIFIYLFDRFFMLLSRVFFYHVDQNYGGRKTHGHTLVANNPFHVRLKPPFGRPVLWELRCVHGIYVHDITYGLWNGAMNSRRPHWEEFRNWSLLALTTLSWMKKVGPGENYSIIVSAYSGFHQRAGLTMH